MAVQMQPVPGQPGMPAGQPGAWMQAPAAPANCPPGLEYLTQIDQLLVHQQVELLEAFVGFETNNKYEIKNSMGQRVYFAAEDARLAKPSSPSKFKTPVKNDGLDFCRIIFRPLKVAVEAPPGHVIGYVKQAWSVCKPKYYIQNAQEETCLVINGPCCTCSICGDVEFDVMSSDNETQVGKISKQWTGLIKEVFTDADNFGVAFPMDLDVNVKATMLGAVFLIDFMFFEKEQNKEEAQVGMM